MHYGDQIFFKPLFKQLKKAEFPVMAITSKELEFFFEQKDKVTFNPKKTLFVSSNRLLGYLKSKFGSSINYFVYDTNALGVDEPITNFIVNRFSDYFNISEFLGPVVKENFIINPFSHNYDLLDLKEEYIILNNYYDSGKARIFLKDQRLLIRALTNEKNNYKVIHTGSTKDKIKDKYNYKNIVDIDLRGKTKLNDLYLIFSKFKIVRLYTFDTFTLHLANIFDINSRIIFRRWYKKGEKHQKFFAFSSLYKKTKNNITIVNK